MPDPRRVPIDFSDPTQPFIADQIDDGSNVWDVRLENGPAFVGNIGGGLGVVKLTGE